MATEGGGGTTPRRVIHVVNLGAFEVFATQAQTMALDLFHDSSAVMLHDFDATGASPNTSAARLEPWLHRFHTFDTLLDRLTGAIGEGKVLHDVVLCLPPDIVVAAPPAVARSGGDAGDRGKATPRRPWLGTAQVVNPFGKTPGGQADADRPDEGRGMAEQGAPASEPPSAAAAAKDGLGPDGIRQALAKLNLPASKGCSVVLFTVVPPDKAKGIAALASGLKTLLGHDPGTTIYHARNGILATVDDSSSRTGFIALRMFIEVMRSKDWTTRWRFGPDRAASGSEERVDLLSLTDTPSCIASEVIAGVLAKRLDGYASGTTDGHGSAKGDELVQRVKSAIADIQAQYPTGGAGGNAQLGSGKAPGAAMADGKPNPYSLRKPHEEFLRRHENGDAIAGWQGQLQDWYVRSRGNLKVEDDATKAIDAKIAGIRLRQGSPQTSIPSLREEVRKELDKQKRLANACQRKLDELLAEGQPIGKNDGSGLAGLKSYQTLDRLGSVYRRHLADAVPPRQAYMPILGLLLFWVVAWFAGFVGAMRSAGVEWTAYLSWPQWGGQGKENAHHRMLLWSLVVFATACVAVLIAVYRRWRILTKAHEEVAAAAVTFAQDVDSYLDADWGARRHAIAASQLSNILAKLRGTITEQREVDYVAVLGGAAQPPDDDWAKKIAETTGSAYDRGLRNSDTRTRLREVLKGIRSEDLPTGGGLKVASSDYQEPVLLSQNLVATELSIRLYKPAGTAAGT